MKNRQYLRIREV